MIAKQGGYRRNPYFCIVKSQTLLKYGLNLGAFILVFGGISLLDRGAWAAAGVLMAICGLVTGAYSVHTVYMNRQFRGLSAGTLLLVAITGLLILMLAQFFVSKKGVSWELEILFALLAVFLFYVRQVSFASASNRKKAG